MNDMDREERTINEILEAPYEPLDFTSNGKCSNCGACCSNLLPVSVEEIKTIKKYIREHEIKQAVNGIPFNADINMVCPFLDTSKELKCKIYEVRPKICRFFMCNKKPDYDELVQMADMMPVNMRNTFFG